MASGFKPSGPASASTTRTGRARLVGRVLGIGEDPMSWSFPLGRLGGIAIRAHVIWPVFVVAELLWSLPGNRLGAQFVGILLAGLLAAMVVRETARLLVRTVLVAKPERLVLWPLGDWSISSPMKSELSIAAAGFLATGVLAIVSASTLVLMGVPRVVEVFNPVMLNAALASLTPAQVPVWAVYAASLVLLVLHLIPGYPLDGGRLVAAILARRGHAEGARAKAGTVGVLAGLLVAVLALVIGSVLLLALGVIVLWSSFSARQRARFLETPDSMEWLSPAARPAPDEFELDALLEKISQTGIDSLTSEERNALKRASERHSEPAS